MTTHQQPVPFEITDNRVNLGLVANDGTGDDLRSAFEKINNSFEYLGTRIGPNPAGANLGSTGESVFKEVVNFEYRFRKIDADGNLRVRLVGDVITLDFRPNSSVNFYNQDIANAGSVTATAFVGPVTGNVAGNVTGNLTGTILTAAQSNITSVGILGGLTVTAPISGSVTGNAGTVTNGVYTTGDQTIGGVKTFNSAVNADLIGDVTGMIKTTGTDTYVDVSDLERRINTFDYGVINPVFVDPIRYYLYAVGTDMGTFNNPSEFGIDAGTL